jgi:hypothetical protein
MVIIRSRELSLPPVGQVLTECHPVNILSILSFSNAKLCFVALHDPLHVARDTLG